MIFRVFAEIKIRLGDGWVLSVKRDEGIEITLRMLA